jgi:hypothetical protein
VSLRDFYGNYGSKKEREAYAAAVLYLGATVAALVHIPSTHGIFLVGLALATALAVSFVSWQLRNRHIAARMVAASTTVASRWLGTPPDISVGGCRQRAHCGLGLTELESALFGSASFQWRYLMHGKNGEGKGVTHVSTHSTQFSSLPRRRSRTSVAVSD